VEKIVLDVDSLTLGELEEFEELTGLTLDSLVAGRLPAKAITTLVFLTTRRANPEFTLDDARQLPLSALEEALPDPPSPTASLR